MRTQLIVVGSLLAGFAGGLLGSRYSRTAESAVVRAQRFELINDSGTTLAYWGKGDDGSVGIVFVGKKHPQAFFGMSGSGTPQWSLSGSDGRLRAQLFLAYAAHNRPTMYLRDENDFVRVHFGFAWNDAPSAEDDDWMLGFKAPRGGMRRPLAHIGMHRNWTTGILTGGMSAHSEEKPAR